MENIEVDQVKDLNSDTILISSIVKNIKGMTHTKAFILTALSKHILVIVIRLNQ